MSKQTRYDAVVVGAGPNGLAAAITLARAGRSVVVYEASETVGGGSRTKELTLPGFRHDVCSAIHPLGVASPFFRSLPLDRYGLEWVSPSAPLAHPLDDGAVVLERSLSAMETSLGKLDGASWQRQPTRNGPTSVAFGAGSFVGTRWKGRIVHSADAADWREVHKADYQIEAAAYGKPG